MKRFILFLIVAMVMSACSGSAKKKDDQVVDQDGNVIEQQDPDGFMTDEVKTEEVPDADKFESAEVAKGEVSTTIDAGVSADINEALQLAARGDKDGAASMLSSSVDTANGGFLAAFNLGVIRERQGMYDKAATRYFQALQKNPDFSPALENLVRLYLKKGQTSDADRLVSKFTNERPENLGHRAVGLLVPLSRGAYEDVISNAKQILRKDERHVDAMVAMSQANFALERYELAKSIVLAAVKLRPTRADLYHLAGLIDVKRKNTTAAIGNFQEALKHSPSYPEARNNLGVLFHGARDYSSAETEFKAAIRDYPDFKEAYLNLGNTYKGQKKYKDAELAFKRVITLDGTYPDAHFNLGILYLDSEVPGMDAIARFQKAIDSFNQYKKVSRNVSKDDPADKYIGEANKKIEIERQKQEMLRETQKEESEAAPEEGSE